jgi:hypothetical protein
VIVSLPICITPELGNPDELESVSSTSVADIPELRELEAPAKVTSPAEVVDLIGVISFKLSFSEM